MGKRLIDDGGVVPEISYDEVEPEPALPEPQPRPVGSRGCRAAASMLETLQSLDGGPHHWGEAPVSMSVVRAFDGCYEAKRAAALSGVPLSTVYYWARTGVVVPSISQERPKLWSYADLMGLRIVHWLRHPKGVADEALPASPMRQVRQALERVQRAGLDLWEPQQVGPGRSPLRVDRRGKVFVAMLDGVVDTSGQGVLGGESLDLLGVFEVDGCRGPDLRMPRARLRIVPGKVAGEPHVAGTRITTPALAALRARGFAAEVIAELYPEVPREAIAEALELEDELAGLAHAA